MLNANGNYIGFGNPRQLQITGNNESFQQDGYQVIKFYYQSGSVISGNGTGSFTLPDQKQVEFLVIGGGGSSGIPDSVSSFNFFSDQKQGGTAGGGAGTLITGSFLGLKGMEYNVIVGAGGFRNWGTQGSPTTDPGKNGAPSLLSGISAAGSMSIIAPGGGFGGSTNINTGTNQINGNNGGSGGGAGLDIQGAGPFITLGNSGSAVTGTATGVISYQSLQNNGGAAADSGVGTNSLGVYGGGGGSSTVGGDANFAGATGGNGGTGTFNAMSGSGRYFAGGGAGGYNIENSLNAYYGIKGQGGGGGAIGAGTGSYLTVQDGKGEEQTGGGGAGGWSGGSGVIIVRYKLSGESL